MRLVIGEPRTPPLPAGLPDDWVQPRDVPCPTCRYNLRMLHTPRCPECGSVFRWQQLLRVYCPRCDASLIEVDGDRCPQCDLALNWRALLESGTALDRTLFEYSDHPVRAALQTWVAALNPWSFWRRITLEMPPAVERLRRFQRAGLLTAASGALLLISLSLRIATRPPLARPFLALLAMLLTVPLTTSLALPRFTPTLARFRIRSDQLLRCLAYSKCGLFWLGQLFFCGFALAWVGDIPVVARWAGIRRPLFFSFEVLLGPGLPGFLLLDRWIHGFNLAVGLAWVFFALVWWWAFLYVALRRYLRLNRRNAVALFLSTQAIGVLLLMVLLLQLHVATMALGAWQLRLAAWVRHLWGT
jgi:hypothetical protein